ncbi:MAG TPA: ABC transporter substrate-binding protein [Verrucomicrobiae bacterium]|nr:ABC transporter substrate-binding protein [Verrucomicrobiae bacterium]
MTRALRRHLVAVAVVAALASLTLASSLSPAVAAPARSGTTVTAVISADPPSLDPALGFDPISWSFIHASFVTLLTFNNSISIVPWGASGMPSVSGGGRVYTFHLRRGLVFSDGEPVTAQDYAAAITRILNPRTKSLLMAFYQIIAGATAYSDHRARSVSGIQVLGADTLRFTLVRPDRTFLDIMAIPNASAVPPKVIARNSAQFGLHPVGDGPYVVQSYVPGREITLVKNPTYFEAKQVSVQRIEITIGLTPEVEALRVENGSADVMMDTVPTPVYIALRTDPRFRAYLHHFTAIADNYVAFNLTKFPFTSRRVRQAAAYAVDDQQVLRAISRMGTPLTQILAPGMPGFDPSVEPLGYHPERARQLLAQAGHARGRGLPVLTFAVATGGFTAGSNVAQVVQQDLERVGFRVVLRVMAPGAFLSSLGRYPLTMGIYGIDYPDPYDLIASQFACSEIAAGNNWQDYCNHAVDRQLNASLGLSLAQSIPVYRRLQAQIFAAFPWIPLYYQELWYLVNPRIKGFGANPIWPMMFANWRA